MQKVSPYWQQRAVQAREISGNWPFDPTYGYDLEKLLAVEPVEPPSDFAAFWQATYREALEVAPQAEFREVKRYPYEEWRCFEVEFTSWQGFRVGGWLVEPVSGEVAQTWVYGHGYGGRTDAPPGLMAGAAVLYVCARGFSRSARPDLPNEAMQHVLHGIDTREGYILRACVADLWAGTTVLKARYPGRPTVYYGSSFGGGLGALASAWEPRWKRLYLGCPTFGHHPLRVEQPCVGSGEAVRLHYLKDPAVLEVLRYFDASSAALLTQTETFIDVGCYDPAVPPQGQFAVFNALRRSLLAHRFTVHTCHHHVAPSTPYEERETMRQVMEWFWE